MFARLIFSLFLQQAASKFVACYPDMTVHDRWIYCTKMAFGLGKVAEITSLNYYITSYATEESNYDNL